MYKYMTVMVRTHSCAYDCLSTKWSNLTSLVRDDGWCCSLYGDVGSADESSTVLELQQQLREKNMELTDTQLEALSSAEQLEQLRAAMNKMKVFKRVLMYLRVLNVLILYAVYDELVDSS